MRLAAPGGMGLALAALLAGCAPYTHPVDPEIAAERAATGAVLGAVTGAAIGATLAINPGYGALIGTEVGAGVGAGIGIATTPPPPEYVPVAAPADNGPHFYDVWPPGYYRQPRNPETKEPNAG